LLADELLNDPKGGARMLVDLGRNDWGGSRVKSVPEQPHVTGAVFHVMHLVSTQAS
jgi:anthranilate/para-aminobenzoate synthase component I